MRVNEVQDLLEMAAKKICPTCGKSMAGNHYWYKDKSGKGGWKCKKGNLPTGATQPQQAPHPASQQPTHTPGASATAPAKPAQTPTPNTTKVAKPTPAAAPQKPTKDAQHWLNEFGGKNAKEVSGGKYAVEGDITITGKFIGPRLPVDFESVSGDFNCGVANLETLDGSPHKIGGDFICSSNKLTTFEGGPKVVGGDYVGSKNPVTSIEGLPSKIGGSLYLSDCTELTSLKGIHKIIKSMGEDGFGILSVVDSPVESNVLGVFLIKGLKEIEMDNKNVAKIINNQLSGDRDIHIAQEELIEAGFEKFARL